MKTKPILILYAAILLFPVPAGAADDFRAVAALAYPGLDGPVRLHNDLVVFSHARADGNAHNAVLLDPLPGSARNAVEGVPGARFVAEDARYLVYSSLGNKGYSLSVRDKQNGTVAATMQLRRSIQWGHIDGDRLIVAQGGAPNSHETSLLVYGLPALGQEKSADITGGNDIALWGNKIVAVSFALGIHDAALNRIAAVDMPARAAGGHACSGGSLRISGDKAVVATDCDQLVVVDLPSASIERVIPVSSGVRVFDVAEGVIVIAIPGAREVRALELASGVELARLPMEADFLVLRGNRLLTMKRGHRSEPALFTVYEVNLSAIKSETARVARVKDGCGAAERAFGRHGDPHAAIEACEKSGIRGFIDEPRRVLELAQAVGNYGVWLARTFSRYNEGLALLERLGPADARLAAELAAARRKSGYLNPAAGDAPAAENAPAGVTQVPVNLGGFTDAIAFEGDRIYIGRWLCKGKPRGYPGVVLEVIDRATFQPVKQLAIAECDFTQQDIISAIVPVPGRVVVGIMYRIPREGRPNVVVVDAGSLEVKSRGYIGRDVSWLQLWEEKLLLCVTPEGQPKHRFDPESASLVPATPAETKVCVQDGAGLKSVAAANVALAPAVETARFRAQRQPGGVEFSYRIAGIRNPSKTLHELPPRAYSDVLPAAGRDALVLAYESGSYRRFALHDIAARNETLLFELDPAGRSVTSALWRDYLFVAPGRDLLVYDLKRRITVKYEKDLMREGVKRLFVDNDRLIASLLDHENSRVLDLNVYLAQPPTQDFFAPR